MSSIKIPPAVLESWPAPNYVNPPSHAHIMIGAETALIIITTIIVGLRTYTRSFLTTGRINLDDWLMITAWLLAVVTTILNLVAVNYGWGLHLYDVRLGLLEMTQKIAFATEIVFLYCVCFTKLSILAFYQRVFGTYKTLRILSIIGACYVIGWTLLFTIVVICQCIPVQAFWDSTIKNPTCINSFAANMSAPILNSVSDVYLFLIPIKWVWDLQLPKRQRAGLVFAFGLGLIVVIAGFIRLHYLKVLLRETYDITWDGVSVYIATSVESNVGIICASIPALKPMFVSIFPSLRHTNISSNRSYKLRDAEELEIVSPQVTRVKTQNRYAADEVSL